MTTELTLLQQQVADLWRRFKAPEETVIDDGSVARLAERVAALERKRRELLERRAALQLEISRQRQKAAGGVPVWRALGVLVGLGVFGGALWRWPEVLALPLDHGPAAVVLAGSLALGGLAVRR